MHDSGVSTDPPLIVVSMKDYEDVTVNTQMNKILQTGIRMELVEVGIDVRHDRIESSGKTIQIG